MPTARFEQDGEISATVSSLHAIDRYNLGFQALPWLEVTFRYARLDRYLEPHEGGDLYDRSLGFKIKLLQETDFLPSVAIGAQDILGTGAQGAEYINASKQFGDFDATLGLGWRRYSGFASFTNPLALIFPSFKQTDKSITTGQPLLDRFFHGPNVGLFGGVSWQTPIRGLQLLLELSGDKYQEQQEKGGIDVRTPLNFGFSYEPWTGVQIGAGYLYGSEFGVRVTFHANPFDPEPAQRLGEQPTPIRVRTPDARADAVLDFLEEKTQFYQNWQEKTAIAAQPMTGDVAVAALQPEQTQTQANFVDAVFTEAEGAKVRLVNAETQGSRIILEIGGTKKLSCGVFVPANNAAWTNGFTDIVLRTKGDVKVCHVTADNSAKSGQPAVLAVSDRSDDQLSSAGGTTDASPSATADTVKARILAKASAQGLFIQSIAISPRRIEIAYSNGLYRTESEAIGRLLRILMSEAPDSVEEFRLVSLSGYIPVLSTTFRRSDIERTYNLDGHAAELLPLTDISDVDPEDPLVEASSELSYPRFNWSIAPGFHQSFFDPTNPYNFAVFGALGAGVDLTPNFSISGDFEANIYTTFTKDTRVSNSLLPHVRSDFVSYYQKGKNGIGSLQADYFAKLTPDVYAIARAGYLESMFAGVGGEVLWQPAHKRWALDASLYEVQQRSFNELFGFRDYRVLTGHVAAYYSSPYYGLDFALYVGRYLAGDYGGTFEVRRRFDSGVEIGAYVTLTNVPFHIYGEGSFDKGFIIRIPVDFLAPINSQDEAVLDFTPLTRDGGQRLENEQTLYYAIRRPSEQGTLENWNNVLQP